jgi:hypothetical protein
MVLKIILMETVLKEKKLALDKEDFLCSSIEDLKIFLLVVQQQFINYTAMIMQLELVETIGKII